MERWINAIINDIHDKLGVPFTTSSWALWLPATLKPSLRALLAVIDMDVEFCVVPVHTCPLRVLADTAIYQALFVCGLTAQHALKVVQAQQRIGGYNGWTTHLAEALSHTCKEDADKNEWQRAHVNISPVQELSFSTQPFANGLTLGATVSNFLTSCLAVRIAELHEYVVEDVDGEMTGSEWSPPPLPSEHVQQLKALGLL
ncbi:hypothetical protein CK203_066930 [Vitis vinifera]|uniref:Uncharacterized protein n=1 Tax=Vitis vinifera TaxID=29760 RepID=A0A438F5A0_VITVI|nr:hypothetical protein CK203_066930 [Vitis vinifera]